MPTDSLEPSGPAKSGPNLIFLGPPGAGKGSLAAKLCSLNLEHVSSGEFFRAEVARGTSHSRAFERALARGEFVSDDQTLSLMRKWFFGRKSGRGFLLDGFPRNLLQAKVLSEWLDLKRESLAGCLYLTLSRDEAVKRISERRTCPSCGTVYHLSFYPPVKTGLCDQCRSALIQRSDDTEETVINRWRLFEENTLPVVEYYREQGLLLSFSGSSPLEEVYLQIVDCVTNLSLT